jgi:hypothetical protein
MAVPGDQMWHKRWHGLAKQITPQAHIDLEK